MINTVIISSKGCAVTALIWAVGKLTFGMKGHFQPVGICTEFSLVIDREITDGEIVMIVMKEKIQSEFCSIFPMN